MYIQPARLDEVDGYATGVESGWSVVVQGVIEPVLDTVRRARLDRVDHQVWVDDVERTRWVLVPPALITGRRIHQPK